MLGFEKVEPVSAHRRITAEPKVTIRKYAGKKGETWTANLNRACMAAVGWKGGEMVDVMLSNDGERVAIVLGDTRSLYETGQIQFSSFQETAKMEQGVYPAAVREGGLVLTKSERREYVGNFKIGAQEPAPAEADL